jgi:hypothetical protein
MILSVGCYCCAKADLKQSGAGLDNRSIRVGVRPEWAHTVQEETAGAAGLLVRLGGHGCASNEPGGQ